MKFTRLSLALIALSVMLMVGCKKDDPGPSKTQLLTQHTWKYSAVSSSNTQAQGEWQDVLIDSELVFAAAGSYILTLDNDGVVLGAWEFAENETKLIWDKNTSREIYFTIDKLDATALDATFTESGINVTFKFVKK